MLEAGIFSTSSVMTITTPTDCDNNRFGHNSSANKEKMDADAAQNNRGCYTASIICCSIGRIGTGGVKVVEEPGPEDGWNMMDEGNPGEEIYVEW